LPTRTNSRVLTARDAVERVTITARAEIPNEFSGADPMTAPITRLAEATEMDAQKNLRPSGFIGSS
jgi:hypothetical protein